MTTTRDPSDNTIGTASRDTLTDRVDVLNPDEVKVAELLQKLRR